MFQVSYDTTACVLRLRLAGFWTLDTVAAFSAELHRVVALIDPPVRRFDILSDSTGFEVQSREVTAALTQAIDTCCPPDQGRVAIVVGSMLNKLQAERQLDRSSARLFFDIEEATAWLAQG